jgi:hypothetical protein
MGDAVVTVEYTSGANEIFSTSDNPVASFSPVTVVNLSDRVGGPNPAYPVVTIPAATKIRQVDPRQLGASDTRRATLFLPNLKIDSLPTAGSTEIFGSQTGIETMKLEVSTSGELRLRLYGATTTNLLRLKLFTMTPGTSYNLLVSIDSEQSNYQDGSVVIVDDVEVDNGQLLWAGGAGELIGWTRTSNTDIGSDDIDFSYGAIWLDTENDIDIQDAATRALFTSVTNGDLDIGTLGNGVTGSSPSLFIVGNAAQHDSGSGINRGTAAKFFLNTGSAEDDGAAEWI